MNSGAHAVVLLSGGLDSSTALAWAIREMGWKCHSVAFDYGQRHRIELEASRNVANSLGIDDHRIIKVDLAAIGGSALTGNIDVPKDQHQGSAIPITYVPARNMIFLSIAVGMAETVGASKIVIGANVVDYSGYPDCRHEFLESFATTATLGTKMGAEGSTIEIIAPLLKLNKSAIIELGSRLGVDYSLTHSCYDPLPSGRPCGHCDSCLFRKEGFARLSKSDPLIYPD